MSYSTSDRKPNRNPVKGPAKKSRIKRGLCPQVPLQWANSLKNFRYSISHSICGVLGRIVIRPFLFKNDRSFVTSSSLFTGRFSFKIMGFHFSTASSIQLNSIKSKPRLRFTVRQKENCIGIIIVKESAKNRILGVSSAPSSLLMSHLPQNFQNPHLS